MLKRYVQIIALCLILAATSALAQTQGGANSTEKAVRELLNLTGAGKLGVQIAQQLVGSFKKSMPNVPAAFWDEFLKDIDTEGMTKLVIPIYAKHFTVDEINGMIAFYKTPLGQKLTHELPSITQESMAAGQQWGSELGRRVADRLKAKGYN